MNKKFKEPTKGDVINFVESQLYDMKAYGYAHKDSLVEGIMELMKKQHDYATQEATQECYIQCLAVECGEGECSQAIASKFPELVSRAKD